MVWNVLLNSWYFQRQWLKWVRGTWVAHHRYFVSESSVAKDHHCDDGMLQSFWKKEINDFNKKKRGRCIGSGRSIISALKKWKKNNICSHTYAHTRTLIYTKCSAITVNMHKLINIFAQLQWLSSPLSWELIRQEAQLFLLLAAPFQLLGLLPFPLRRYSRQSCFASGSVCNARTLQENSDLQELLIQSVWFELGLVQMLSSSLIITQGSSLKIPKNSQKQRIIWQMLRSHGHKWELTIFDQFSNTHRFFFFPSLAAAGLRIFLCAYIYVYIMYFVYHRN